MQSEKHRYRRIVLIFVAHGVKLGQVLRVVSKTWFHRCLGESKVAQVC